METTLSLVDVYGIVFPTRVLPTSLEVTIHSALSLLHSKDPSFFIYLGLSNSYVQELRLTEPSLGPRR